MSWEKEIEELGRRREMATRMGGKEGIAKQHARASAKNVKSQVSATRRQSNVTLDNTACCNPVAERGGFYRKCTQDVEA